MERRGFFADTAARYVRFALLLFCALCLLGPAKGLLQGVQSRVFLDIF